MAYDASTGKVVLFGGELPNPQSQMAEPIPQNRTWTWNGRTWVLQHPTSPPARSSASMVYDSATGQVVMFGGVGHTKGDLFDDTWTWDGSNWTEQRPATSPPARTDAGMAYDAASRQVVLFAGNGGSANALSDTWSWDGKTWTRQEVSAGPSGPNVSAAYDSNRREIVAYNTPERSRYAPPAPSHTLLWNGSWRALKGCVSNYSAQGKTSSIPSGVPNTGGGGMKTTDNTSIPYGSITAIGLLAIGGCLLTWLRYIRCC